MNKKKVNGLIGKAKEALIQTGLACDGKINSAIRGDISSFAATAVMSSLPAAVAFYLDDKGTTPERQKLIQAVFYCIRDDLKEAQEPSNMLDYVCRYNGPELREEIMNASIALKLAMHYFEFV